MTGIRRGVMRSPGLIQSPGVLLRRLLRVGRAVRHLSPGGGGLRVPYWAMGLYTRFGDKGETALSDGSRVWKDDVRVSAYGTVDELNTFIGSARVLAGGAMANRLLAIQHDLFAMGAQLAAPSVLASGVRAGCRPR